MNSASDALRAAVHQQSLTSAEGFQQRLFSLWFNSFIYNQIWEDPAVDLEALQLRHDSRVLTIASGGCNILNYLTHSPKQIIAIDLNQNHLALSRLKIAAMEHLPNHEAFYDFFGHADKAANIERYNTHIAPRVHSDLNNFWTDRGLLKTRRINLFSNGLYRHTRFGYFMRFLHWIAKHSNYEPQRLLNAQSLPEQREVFEHHIRPFFDNRFVRLLGKLPMSVFSLGIPPQQYQAMKKDGNLVQQFCQRVERIACDFPVQNNYFAWQGFSHSYDHTGRQAIPEYLKREHYDRIRDQLHKVETHLGSLTDFLRTRENNSLDRFVFLDAQDWMSDDALVNLWQQVVRVGKAGSRIIFRTAASESPLEHALPNEIRNSLLYHPERSQELFIQDRSAIYGGFHLYELKA